MNIKLFSFHKNEDDILEDWIIYHSNIFGLNNIFIIDHNSNEYCQNILRKYHEKGLNFIYYNGEFSTKSWKLSNYIIENRDHENTDLIIPIDIDEFIVGDNIGIIETDPNRIIYTFNKLPLNGLKYKFSEYTVNCNKFEFDDPLIQQTNLTYKNNIHLDRNKTTTRAKTFYPCKLFSCTDQGNHFGMIDGDNSKFNYDTNLALIHFEFRGYSHFYNKILKGASAYGFDKYIPKENCLGNHWKKRYMLLKENKLEEYYKNEIMKNNGIDNFDFSDIISYYRRKKMIF